MTTGLIQAAPDHTAPAKLTGTYSIGPESLIDPEPNDSKNALLRLHLTGRAAKDLFNAISSKPTRGVCFDDRVMMKISPAGEIMCAKFPKGSHEYPKGAHECWIGINLEKHTLANAFLC
jgi:hypothetical protein